MTKLPSGAAGGNADPQGLPRPSSSRSPARGAPGVQLDGTIVTAILTDDGRLAVGAVGADVVSSALAR